MDNRIKPKDKIKNKLILFGIIITIAATSFFSFFSIQHEKHAILKELNERAEALAESFALNCQYGLETRNIDELKRLSECILKQKDVIQVQIFEENKPLVTKKKDYDNSIKKMTVMLPIMGIQKKVNTSEEIFMDFNRSQYKTQIGKIKLTFSKKNIYQRLKELKKMSLYLSLTTILLVIIGITIMANNLIGKPISELLKATRQITAGDLSVKVNYNSKSELGELAQTFNLMTTALKESKEKIEEYNKTLEEKVEQRTQELKNSQKKLIQTSKMAAVGQLAGGVAHEINNPVGIILGFSQSIMKKIKKDDSLYLPLKSIEREAIRCRKLISNLLSFSRTEKVSKEIINVNEIIEEPLSLIETQAKTTNVEIVKNYDRNLPEIKANKSQIEQVVMNLANNALYEMPDGGKLEISTTLAKEKNGKEFVKIEIGDTGKGVPEEIINKIFEPFFTTKDVGKGTGLGLSLCYEIIKNHDGTIQVGNKPEGGAVFTIKLPVNE